MKGISLTLNNNLVFDREFLNREERRTTNNFVKGLSKKAYKSFVFLIAAFGLMSIRVSADIGEAMSKTDYFGNQLLTIVQRVGFWVAVVGCLIEILVCVFQKKGGQKEILASIFKWLLTFSSFYLVPVLFKFIVEAFA